MRVYVLETKQCEDYQRDGYFFHDRTSFWFSGHHNSSMGVTV